MDISEDALKAIAERLNTGYVGYEKLSTGAHNLNLKLETDDGFFVVRIAPPTRLERLEKEYRFLRNLNGRFGPKVHLFDESNTLLNAPFLVQEFIEGTHPVEADDAFVTQMAAWYQELHAVGCPPTVPHADTKGHYSLTRFYDEMIASRYDPHKDCVPLDWQEVIESLFTRVRVLAREHNDLLTDARCAVVHWDPNLRNVFYTTEEIKVVDWEFVSFDAPEWDLVAFIWAHDLHDEKEQQFLEQYGYVGDRNILDVLLILFTALILAWRVKRLHLIQSGDVLEGLKHGEAQELIEQFSWLTQDLDVLLTAR